MISETDRINHVELKTKGILRVASTQNFEDFKGFSVLNRRRRKNWTGIDQNGYTCVLRGHSVEYGCRFASVRNLSIFGSRAVGLGEFQQMVFI